MSASMRLVTARPSEALIDEYLLSLGGKATGTVDAYGRILRQLTAWIAARPGSDGFQPEHFTPTAMETYLAHYND